MEERTAAEVVSYAKDQGVEIVDLRFCDLPGLMQHFSVPVGQLTEDVFEEGFGFDGSSIRGFQEIQESDMILKPDPDTAVIDPFRPHTTLNINCWVHDPITHESYSRDPRYVAKKAEEYLKSTGLADTCYFGPEAEFFIFDDVRFEQTPNRGFYQVDSIEAAWNTGRDESRTSATSRGTKEGYFPVPPMDQYQDLRSEMALTLHAAGHRRRGAAPRGRHRRPGRDRHPLRLAAAPGRPADAVQVRHQERGVGARARRRRSCRSRSSRTTARACTRTSRCGRAASRCSTTRTGYAGLSDMARWYIGGLLAHARSVVAFSNPTTNSFKRLVPGYEAPVNLVYSQRNRSASVRIPLYSQSPKAKRLEFRVPDPSCNPYLAFSAMLMAGLDGIQNRTEPPAPLDKDLYDLPPEELAKVPQVPASLEEALDALEADQDFLKAGGVFTDDLIDTWIELQARERGRRSSVCARTRTSSRSTTTSDGQCR